MEGLDKKLSIIGGIANLISAMILVYLFLKGALK